MNKERESKREEEGYSEREKESKWVRKKSEKQGSIILGIYNQKDPLYTICCAVIIRTFYITWVIVITNHLNNVWSLLDL